MEKHRAIPDGYMTAGQIAKIMGVTVRTIQYYDTKKLLTPSAVSEGGRRLYTHRDLIKLHQILSLKSLGFSLEDIKGRLYSLDTPEDVANALSSQADLIQGQIEALSRSLRAINQLREEVLQIQSVDFKKYADIIVNLQMGNKFYYLIKHFDEDTLNHIRQKFDRDSGLDFIRRFDCLCDDILRLKSTGAAPNSPQCQKLAGKFWDMVTEFTGGDTEMLPKLIELGGFEGEDSGQWAKRQAIVNEYMGPALEIYFQRLGINPFGGGKP